MLGRIRITETVPTADGILSGPPTLYLNSLAAAYPIKHESLRGSHSCVFSSELKSCSHKNLCFCISVHNDQKLTHPNVLDT